MAVMRISIFNACVLGAIHQKAVITVKMANQAHFLAAREHP